MNRNLALQDEFENDPNGYGYLSMNDQQRYDRLILEDIPILIPIASIATSGYLESINKWNQMNQLSVIDQSQTPPVPRLDAAFHMTLVLGTFDSFDMNDPVQNTVFTNLMNAMVSNNVLTQAEADDILAFGDSLISRDTEIGVDNVKIGEIEQARV